MQGIGRMTSKTAVGAVLTKDFIQHEKQCLDFVKFKYGIACKGEGTCVVLDFEGGAWSLKEGT